MIGPKIRLSLLLCAVSSLVACRESTGFEAGETETSSSTGSSESEGFPEPDECEGSEACEDGYCVAAWDGELPRGPAQCVDSCVAELDLSLFCIDDASCCEELSCSLDGLCEAPWTGDGDGDPTGDGDGDPTGDGDGDPTGDGDGDGDPTGDGDGDPTGDGDGDP